MSTPSVLAVSLASEPVVGSNLRGELTGAGWLYALPRLRHDRIVTVGRPSAATRAALARAGTVSSADDAGQGPIDLLVLNGRRAGAEADRRGLLDRLSPAGLVVVESGARRPGGLDGEALTRLAVTPARGQARSIAPVGDRAMRRALRDLGLEGTVARSARVGRLERRLLRFGPLRRAAGREILVGGPGRPADGVPAYLRSIAAADDLDLTGWSWGVAARGDYDSQKVLVLLAPPGAEAPTGLAKVTRGPAYADRLRNEATALRRLSDLPVAEGRVPSPWFSGSADGRVILGESLIPGRPFAAAATFRHDDPPIGDALGWLVDLSAATAAPVPGQAVAEALLALLDRYERVYAPPADEPRALRTAFEGLGASPTLPTVLQHGDPGIWNLLVDEGGRTVFLDWEAAELAGIPLWDLLYLFRSCAIAEGRRSGVRDRTQAAARHLLARSPLSDVLVAAVLDLRARIDLPADAVRPLVLGCWLHRSLKEATRLAPDRLDDGRFVRLLRRTLAEPDAPTMRRLAGPLDGADA